MADGDNQVSTDEAQKTADRAAPLIGEQINPTSRRTQANSPRIVFGLAFVIAVLVTNARFPPSNVVNPVYWILAYSIYASALCGVGALIVELLRAVSGGKPLEWPAGLGFPIYLSITFLTAFVAVLAIESPSRFFSLPGPAGFLNEVDASKIGLATRKGLMEIPASDGSDKLTTGLNKLLKSVDDQKLGSGVAVVLIQIGNDGLADTVFFLEMLALGVVVCYLLADVTGAFWGNAEIFWRLVRVDCVVILVHLASLAVIKWGTGIWIVGQFPSAPREAFMAGCMATTLFLQSFIFASITSRSTSST